MLPGALNLPKRVMLTLDAVGGVWRYAVDLASALSAQDTRVLLVGLGPRPSNRREATCIGSGAELLWTDLQLDWLCTAPVELAGVGRRLSEMGLSWGADLLHLHLPSQAVDVAAGMPTVVTTHSCVSTWWAAVQGTALPPERRWQHDLNAAGFERADVIMAPSLAHARAVQRAYDLDERVQVVPNATALCNDVNAKSDFILAAGRWWDEGKNGALLDLAASLSPWPIVMAGPLNGPAGAHARFSHVELPGELDSFDMASLMGRAAVFAAPSRYEPFGLAVLEAASRGAALVLSDIPTFRELWSDAALFASPDRPQDFAAIFTRLANNPSLRHQMSECARARAQCFTSNRQLEGVHQAYQAALRLSATTSRTPALT